MLLWVLKKTWPVKKNLLHFSSYNTTSSDKCYQSYANELLIKASISFCH